MMKGGGRFVKWDYQIKSIGGSAKSADFASSLDREKNMMVCCSDQEIWVKSIVILKNLGKWAFFYVLY